MCIDLCVDMCIDMCIDLCIDMRIELCIDMCIDTTSDIESHPTPDTAPFRLCTHARARAVHAVCAGCECRCAGHTPGGAVSEAQMDGQPARDRLYLPSVSQWAIGRLGRGGLWAIGHGQCAMGHEPWAI